MIGTSEKIKFDIFLDNQDDRDTEPDEYIDILDKIRLSRFDQPHHPCINPVKTCHCEGTEAI